MFGYSEFDEEQDMKRDAAKKTLAAPPPEMPRLLPCPFCGCETVFHAVSRMHVECQKCLVRIEGVGCVVLWNTRTPKPASERERMLAEAVVAMELWADDFNAPREQHAPAIALAAEIVEAKPRPAVNSAQPSRC